MDLVTIFLVHFAWSVVLTDAQSTANESDLAAYAPFNMGGVRGLMKIEHDENGPLVIDSSDLKGLEGRANLKIHVHDYPMVVGDPSPCDSSEVGGHFDPDGVKARLGTKTYKQRCKSSSPTKWTDCEAGDLTGKFGSFSATVWVDISGTLSVSGRRGISGRSLVVHHANGTRWVCANIYPARASTIRQSTNAVQIYQMNKLRTLRAIFRGPTIAGQVFLRQLEVEQTRLVASSLFARLLVVTSENTSRAVPWAVFQGDSCSGQAILTSQSVRNHSEQEGVTNSSRMGDFTAGGTGMGSTLFGLEGSFPSGEKLSVGLYSSGMVEIACSPMSVLTRSEVSAELARSNLEVTLTQDSPFDPTIVRVRPGWVNRTLHIHTAPVSDSKTSKHCCSCHGARRGGGGAKGERASWHT